MIFALLAAALAAAHPHPSGADAPLSLSRGERETARAASEKDEGDRIAAVDAVAKRYGLAGEVLVARGDRILLDHAYGPIAPAGVAMHRPGERWRLASITKQVTAALVVRQLGPKGVSLDAPIFAELAANDPMFARMGKLTNRQLLTHHSGLPNPDDTPADTAGVPAFYAKPAGDPEYCMSKPAQPGAPFRYNNCDYILASMGLEGIATGSLWPAGLTMARLNEVGVPGFVGGKPEPAFQLASWGAAGGLMGTAKAVFAFDRSLMTGKLLPPAALAELWKPEGNGSYQALGQWVFPGKLAGCATAKRIVQRDGEIYGVQARNFILPDDGLVVIVFTNRSSDDFPIGEVWEGKGFAYDLLSAAARC